MAELVVKKNKIEVSDWYLKNFELLEEHNNGSIPDYVKKIKKDSLEKLIDFGFPTQKVEDWKYTNILPIIENNFKPSNFSNSWQNSEIIEKAKILIESDPIISNLSSNQLVFIDGHFVEDLSKTQNNEKLEIYSLRKALKEKSEIFEKHFNQYSKIENGFNALNNLFFSDGIFLHAKDNLVEDEPIVVIFVQSGVDEHIINPRNLIIVGNNSKIRLIETYISLGNFKNFTNTITEIFISENSFIEHYKFQNESTSGYHIGKIQTQLERNSNFTSHNLAFGGLITRNDVNIVLDGEGAESHFYGLYFVKDHQHVDNHTLVDHAKPHCLSNEFYKGILAENSRGVFNGKIIVRKGAQKTNAYQSNKNLLLSGNAKIDTKPQLEIFADDVRCTHGATVGQVDDDSLFYLRARGIDYNTARSLLVNAFANDVLNNMTFEPLKDKISDFVIEQMNKILQKNNK
ncbi:MAG: Fe-S cluster assembly protein SufD [Ignavibacteria bacterium]|nr:Fe-S cluster assembly protein SufD [Ignavibacteria bacterium]